MFHTIEFYLTIINTLYSELNYLENSLENRSEMSGFLFNNKC